METEKDPMVEEEEKDIDTEEVKVEEEKEEAVENPDNDEEQDEAIAEEAVLEHASGDEDKWNNVFDRLDALELRIGELMMQGGPGKSDMEEIDEVSDIELENQKWYERNSQTLNNY